MKGNIGNIKNIIIAIAGPFVNILCSIIILIFSKVENANVELLEIITYINLIIALFNMLPIYPLDGGRILKEIICIFKGREKAMDITNKVSNITLVVLTILSSMFIMIIKNIAIVIIVIFLFIVVIKENKKYKTLKQLYKIVNKGKKK